MEQIEGPPCSFTVEEITAELGKLKSRKAGDLLGLKVELVRWGGQTLLQYVSRFFGEVCKDGLPREWTFRKVVSLYKTGPRTEPSSYRTIMIGNVFSKIFGRILETRLNSWCEENAVRTPAQAGFRKSFSTLDHVLTLRVLMENAQRNHEPLYLLFVDFSKAFVTVSRSRLGDRLSELGVPEELRNAISQLYQVVTAKVSQHDDGVLSTLGVIHGCSLSPTLFGLFIDSLYDLTENQNLGVLLGSLRIGILLFADDIVLVAKDPDQMRTHIDNLTSFCEETGSPTYYYWQRRAVSLSRLKLLSPPYSFLGESKVRIRSDTPHRRDPVPSAAQLQAEVVQLTAFCESSGMKVNLIKTMWMQIGGDSGMSLAFQGENIKKCLVYKYLGLEFASSLRWTACIQSRSKYGLRALFSFFGKCKEIYLVEWKVRKRLFNTLIQSVMLYGAPVWGPALPRTSWKLLERVQKLFLQEELGVRSQIPYDLLLLETGRLPIEVD
ncbi:hypothetical protein R1sor_014117 [Riccia sorocarpa]|uniref:Reverse transcriptase domain-containing protein n=1 Tax=Riccia sorocarpa TaxID=122646 RepID=A0ABD3H8P2_9MARC